MRTLWRAVAIPALAGAALAGCGSDGKTSDASTTAPPTTLATTTTTTVAATTTVPTTVAPSTAAPTTTALAPATSDGGSTTVPDEQPVDGEGIEIIVTVGIDDAVTAGGRVEPVPFGSDVTLRIIDQKPHEYHLHGYDLEQSVPADTEAVFQFTANKKGKFELETHDGNQVMVVLDVS
jgi:hypothetical protein